MPDTAIATDIPTTHRHHEPSDSADSPVLITDFEVEWPATTGTSTPATASSPMADVPVKGSQFPPSCLHVIVKL